MQMLLSPEEIKRRAQKIYDDDIKAKVEPEHTDEFLVIDIESGDYEVGTDDRENMERLRIRRPDGVYFNVRVGFKPGYAIGGAL